MKRFTEAIARGVVKWPVFVIIVTLVLTGVFGFFASKQQLCIEATDRSGCGGVRTRHPGVRRPDHDQ